MRRWRFGSGQRIATWPAACGLALLAALPAEAQAPLPEGAEFQVNTFTTSYQMTPSVAVGADGKFVVAWQSNGSSGIDTNMFSVQGQRYASDGSTQGAQFQVNTYTTFNQGGPSVAVDADGDFVVVWTSFGGSGTDSYFSVQGQRYASDGSIQGGQFQVNTYTTSMQTWPSLAAAADGDFVVVWRSKGSFGSDWSSESIQGQRYASDGSARGAEFQVNSYWTSTQGVPTVAADADGDFVVVWSSRGSFGTDDGIYGSYDTSIQGQRYASDGSSRGAQFQVNTYTTNFQYFPSVAADADGDFIVVWQGPGLSTTISSAPDGFSVWGQRYASDGSARGAEFQVNTYTFLDQHEPRVAADSDGDFVVVWQSFNSFGTDTSGMSIQGQRYTSNGSAQGAEFQINTYTPGPQLHPAVASAAGGDFVVAWDSVVSYGTDQSIDSIQAQRYRAPGPPAVPALSPAAGLALGALLMTLGAGFNRRRRT